MENVTLYLIRSTVNEKGVVKAWEEDIALPTYKAGEEEKSPMFTEKRIYQGSSGVVYPYPVIEKISDEKRDEHYTALFLENEYLKIMILPQLGGRVQMAYDKIRKRHFVYYNQVIKPALVGLTGPWISGGIEFNWPQHHRPSTFLPTAYTIEENPDGSKTVWCNEVERMFRTKGMHGFTLYPGKAYLEIKVKLYNRTPFPQTFLWWANPAVAVNEHYHSVFPSDVHAVYDHGKRDVSNFPIATGIYYKQDYSAGVDISKYKNIPVPTSYMAVQSKYDFLGGFETDTKGGLLHVADHHLSPGKKQWTWGCGDFGKAWDRNLTDEDGPYIELMTGVYTDNQPDFSWLQPNEERSWVQYFIPYSEVGYVKNATKDAIVNIDIDNQKAKIILYTTSAYDNLNLLLRDTGISVFANQTITVSPEKPYMLNIEIGNTQPEDLIFILTDDEGKEILRYQPDKPEIKPMPDAAKKAENPEDIVSIEQLYLTGLHLEQYRHATYNSIDYYREALNREPGNVRCNNAMGLVMMRKGQFESAEVFFRKAIKTLTERNPNPYDGEPHYNLGCSLVIQGKREEAIDAFFKATWNAAWQDSCYYELAKIDASKELWHDALEKIDRSLIRNWHNHKARQLKVSILRKLGRQEEALVLIQDSLKIDQFNLGCYFEKFLLTEDNKTLNDFLLLMNDSIHSYIEYALDYTAAGFYAEASQLLHYGISDKDHAYPMVYYALGYFASSTGDLQKAKEYYIKASKMCPDRCFPNRIEEVNILQNAMMINPSDSNAPYYLGNFWYAVREYEKAAWCWEKSKELNSRYPIVMRNLSLAYFNKLNKKEEARDLLENAFKLDTENSRILMELDQLYKKLGLSPAERLLFLEKYPKVVEQRDDLTIEWITLYNQLGEFARAKELISARKFHPWEGGEGKITKQFVVCHVELAKLAIKEGNFNYALALLHETDTYPQNLGEGKLPNIEENDIDYFKGVAFDGMRNEEKARFFYEKATHGSSEPMQAFFYNDQQPDKIFYQGLAWAALGNKEKSNSRFNSLINHGRKHLFDNCRVDYFAVSLPDMVIWEEDLNVRNKVYCYFMIGLGNLGLKNISEAIKYLNKVRQLDINHLDSHLILKDLSK